MPKTDRKKEKKREKGEEGGERGSRQRGRPRPHRARYSQSPRTLESITWGRCWQRCTLVAPESSNLPAPIGLGWLECFWRGGERGGGGGEAGQGFGGERFCCESFLLSAPLQARTGGKGGKGKKKKRGGGGGGIAPMPFCPPISMCEVFLNIYLALRKKGEKGGEKRREREKKNSALVSLTDRGGGEGKKKKDKGLFCARNAASLPLGNWCPLLTEWRQKGGGGEKMHHLFEA